MILAAGEGRRLRPITDTGPKALVDVAGVSALERVFRAVVAAGARHVVVNAHHFAEEVERAALGLIGSDRSHGAGPDVRVTVSREDRVSEYPLETGGGLALARPLFDGYGPILLHNADILTDVDLTAVVRSHEEGRTRDGRLATLVVTRRETSRPLMVDSKGLYARINRSEGWEVIARPLADPAGVEVGFSGVHVLAPEILPHFPAEGAYSIIDVYVHLVQEGHLIGHYDASDSDWFDIGTPDRLEAARRALAVDGEAE